MFGRNEFTKEVKAALEETGCDRGTFRNWQNVYRKWEKKRKCETARYKKCRRQMLRVQEDAQLMEHMLTRETKIDVRAFGQLLKELKQMNGSFYHAFLVDQTDADFQSTYETILRLGVKALESEEQTLFLQSEIENLQALLEDDLKKPQPQMDALAYYYIDWSDFDLEPLTQQERLDTVGQIYEQEFRAPLLQLLGRECYAQQEEQPLLY